MSVKRSRIQQFVALVLLLSAGVLPSLAASESAKTNEVKIPSLEEIQSKRREIRERLMLPSLVGIKSLGYRVVGFKDYAPLEKAMANKLKQLSVHIEPVMEMKNDSSCDALVQISFVKTGIHLTGDLKVTQWVSLDRNPKIHVKAVTYTEKSFAAGNNAEAAVNSLTEQFVVDFLKANQKDFNLPDADKGAGKTKSESKKKSKSNK